MNCYTVKTGDIDSHSYADTGVHVDVDTLAGPGLEVDGGCLDPLECCPPIQVKAGCNITVDANGVSVDVASLAGDGLAVQAGGYCPKLKVGIEVCPDLIPALSSIDSITVSGTTLTFNYTVTNYKLQWEAGVMCLVADSTSSGSQNVTLPCTSKDVVTGVACNGDGTISVTTDTIQYIDCSGG